MYRDAVDDEASQSGDESETLLDASFLFLLFGWGGCRVPKMLTPSLQMPILSEAPRYKKVKGAEVQLESYQKH